MKKYTKLIISGGLLIALAYLSYSKWLIKHGFQLDEWVSPTVKNIAVIGMSTWVAVELMRIMTRQLLKRYNMDTEDNLKSRKAYTQIRLLEKVAVFVIILVGVGLMALNIDSIKKVGVGIFTSVGVAGIIIGLSAQKIVGALLAGIQIAITQPFRIDDAVVVENEWGWIEEINLTFIVVRLWDKRRLVLPSSYFLENPFQNWTRTTADIIGSVFLYTDYRVPLDELRAELTAQLENTPLWDKQVNVLQVTDSKETTMEIRILVSAKNSPTAWDLRVHIREKMIGFIQEKYPESLPKTRVLMGDEGAPKMAS